MKTRVRAQGPFAERLYLPASHIERQCEDALRSVGLFPEAPSAIRIERFIEKKFGLTTGVFRSASWGFRIYGL
jgi:hypothetical protein